MQKSLRAVTKRPLPMVLVSAFSSFTSSKLGPCTPESGWGRGALAWERLAQPGLAWCRCARGTQALRTVDYFTF